MTVLSNDIQFSTESVPTGGGASFNSPLWRYFLTNLSGDGVVDYSKLAANRVVEIVLNGPLSMTGTVPSDNAQVWLTDDGDKDPYLAPGTRLLWGFRRESATPPYYVPRAATIVQLVEDSAEQDDARTRFTGYDPWRYLFARPVCNADGSLPGEDGISFTATQASVIIGTLLANTIINQGHCYIDAGVTYIGTGFYTGTLETGAGMAIDINFPQGTTVGAAWQILTDMNVCDIILEPIYDPRNRPDYLCQLNVYAQAGVTRDEQIFAWNTPGRSLVGINRIRDMVQAANEIVYFTGQGGVYDRPTAPIAFDTPSAAKYGEYWAQQFFPGQSVAAAVQSLADRQLSLRKIGKETVTFKPAPGRSPRPWQDYQLGDRVPVWAGKEEFRENISGANPAVVTASNANSWFTVSGDYRTLFPAGAAFTALGAGANTGSWVVASSTLVGGTTRISTTVAPADAGAGGNLAVTQYQRIYGWTANISDDALETIDPVLTSPGGFTG